MNNYELMGNQMASVKKYPKLCFFVDCNKKGADLPANRFAKRKQKLSVIEGMTHNEMTGDQSVVGRLTLDFLAQRYVASRSSKKGTSSLEADFLFAVSTRDFLRTAIIRLPFRTRRMSSLTTRTACSITSSPRLAFIMRTSTSAATITPTQTSKRTKICMIFWKTLRRHRVGNLLT